MSETEPSEFRRRLEAAMVAVRAVLDIAPHGCRGDIFNAKASLDHVARTTSESHG